MSVITTQWPTLSKTQLYEIIAIPTVCTIAIILGLWLWPVQVDYDKIKDDEEQPKNVNQASEKTRLLLPGEEAGDYSTPWTQTFDIVLAVFMFLTFGALTTYTTLYKPDLWTNKTFWVYQLPKPVLMMGIGLVCGLICRFFCGIDDNGYIKGSRVNWFKVNYTRKIQHFAAYLIPLVFKVPDSCHCRGTLETAWGQWITILCFALLIKPIRERSTFFMLQFNSMDRPEDRPHTLKWIIGGNIIPGTLCILFFRWLFGPTGQEDLTLIFVFVTGLGDGFAEPVGIWLGRHKYKTRSCTSSRKYVRSYEGSACVFLSGMIFTATTWYAFKSPAQFWFSYFVMPPLMTIAEATSPHTMDTPFLMGLGGLALYLDIKLIH